MDSKTWEKIKSEIKNAPPLARIRKLHPIIQNPKIPKKIRDEAKELAKKARLELDSEHFWKWGGVSLLPTRRTPQLEEEVREERPKRSLEQTVEAAAPDVKPKEEKLIKTEYTSESGKEYVKGGYIGQTVYDRASIGSEGTPVKQTTELFSPDETKYKRKKKS